MIKKTDLSKMHRLLFIFRRYAYRVLPQLSAMSARNPKCKQTTLNKQETVQGDVKRMYA